NPSGSSSSYSNSGLAILTLFTTLLVVRTARHTEIARLPDLVAPVLLDGGGREEPDHLEVAVTAVVEVVSLALREHHDVPGAQAFWAVVAQQLAAAGEDELRLLGGVRMAPESLARREREPDHGRGVRAVAAVGE